ncbi:hypothetical protein [uncultured Tenacibaculum sp.]|uniref:hypothetical protein n=1 Tax=uncultured Tenacibaculum sp. TaxID=174713 RepID=UPI0026356560|nr:hypothetical protein [uncultured Tenacibaculum sp.]
MKKVTFTLLFLFISLGLFSQNSNASIITKKDLIEFIEQSKKEGKINKNPLLVLNEEIVLDIEEINNKQEFFGEIKLISKGNKTMTEIYGKKAINGVVLIQSHSQDNSAKSTENVLFFIREKEISESDLKKIDPNSIKEVRVIKSKHEVKKYTDKVCAGIVVITLHKTN